jgi:hypothetical protein
MEVCSVDSRIFVKFDFGVHIFSFWIMTGKLIWVGIQTILVISNNWVCRSQCFENYESVLCSQ